MSKETRLRGIALLALVGLFVALYLLLYHLGFYGQLMCGTAGCDTVQTSEYARFLGRPVPLWGTAWYAGVMILAFVALGPVAARPGAFRAAVRLLAVAAAGGLLFSLYLTAIELFVIRAVCLWCVASALITVLIFIMAEPWKTIGGGGFARSV
jgi:uncharacterized membrane protein